MSSVAAEILDAPDPPRATVLDAGRIRQRGTPRALIARPGPYQDLWEVRSLVG